MSHRPHIELLGHDRLVVGVAQLAIASLKREILYFLDLAST